MRLIFKIILTFNATSWMLLIYFTKEGKSFFALPYMYMIVLLLCVPVLLSLITIFLARFMGSDSVDGCSEVCLADNEFLPTYLGYFFVSLSVPDNTTMILIYSLVFIFTFISQTQYFNPVYLLFGYHYYHILTEEGTRVFVIARGKVKRNKSQIYFDNLRRINDTTYIERRIH